MTDISPLIDQIRALPVAAPIDKNWPEFMLVADRPVIESNYYLWEYPIVSAKACGTHANALPDNAFPLCAAALYCSMVSIHLVDDMLDEEEDGFHHQLGEGRTANLGLAHQAAGHLLLDRIPINNKGPLQAEFARSSLATCFGQASDAIEAKNENDYWRIVGAKTPPLFESALRLGAIIADADAPTADAIGNIGRTIGMLVQVSDDLSDAFSSPAKADWKKPGNCLPILYSIIVDYDERSCFVELMKKVDDPEALKEAQSIMVRNGAFSYCVHQIIQFWRQAHEILRQAKLQNATALEDLLEHHITPTRKMLAEYGFPDLEALLEDES